MTDIPDWVDQRLRVVLLDGEIVYLCGNPHTYRGRFDGWHPDGLTITLSKNDIASFSEYASVWLDGYLSGSEPPPPPSDSEEAMSEWWKETATYRRTGQLPQKDAPTWWQLLQSRISRR